MEDKKIFLIISDIIKKCFDNIFVRNITYDLNFKKDLDIDSINIMEFILRLEEKFNIEILDKDIEKINTIKDIVYYIKEKINKK